MAEQLRDLSSPLAEVRGRIEQACRRAGRRLDTVQLVAVSKTFSADRVRQALAAGQTVFGENRVQEALGKIDELGPPARWHLIGHLQRNKVRHVVGRFELIHSVDGFELAYELDRRCASAGLRQPILIQVNLSHEATKHGTSEDGALELLDRVAELKHVELAGLMTIPPPVQDAEESRAWFRQLRELRDRAQERLGRPLSELSMGMTDDFEVAVEEGATLVRVGRAIFGARQG